MAGTTVRISAADGGTFECYLAVPGSGSGAGLILAQEIFGINWHMREIADLCAEEGYVVLAADLFWRLAAGVELGDEGIRNNFWTQKRDRNLRLDTLHVRRNDREKHRKRIEQWKFRFTRVTRFFTADIAYSIANSEAVTR